MTKPLNPRLFRRLQDTFGSVRISNQGVPTMIDHRPDWLQRCGRLKAEVVERGETYVVSCPFCSDTRGRLYVCHRWAVRDEKTGDDMLHLARCFNEGCLATREAQKELHALVFPRGKYGRTMEVRLKPQAPTTEPLVPIQIVLPEGTPLTELPKEHPAIEYLRRRKFAPERLARQWGVYFCEENRERPGQDQQARPHFYQPRIVYPVYALPVLGLSDEAGPTSTLRLAGWQARTIDDDSEAPKYFTACGMRRNELLYGLPQAIRTEGPIVVVEGVTDVWRFRANAVALFGKTISPVQCGLFLRHFAGRPIVVLLDRDAAEDARRVCQKIRSSRATSGEDAPVVFARLPACRKDPGECTYKEAWSAVGKALARAS